MNRKTAPRLIGLGAAVAAAAGAALAPAAASAQSYGYGQGGYYQDCRRDSGGRTVAGAIIGGLAGMALGNNIVDDRTFNRRGRVVGDNDTGATVGALLGAGVGAAIGRQSACGTQPTYDSRYYNQQPSYGYEPYGYAPPAYGYAQPAPPPPRYEDDYYYDRYQQAPAYPQDYGYYGDRYDYGRNACRMVESRIRMPDGRTQTRMVQACPDSQGRYQIVD